MSSFQIIAQFDNLTEFLDILLDVGEKAKSTIPLHNKTYRIL
jgi:hypothetical protein